MSHPPASHHRKMTELRISGIELHQLGFAIGDMPTRRADVAASAFAGALNAIPAPLRKTLTYYQGKEMAGHAGLAART